MLERKKAVNFIDDLAKIHLKDSNMQKLKNMLVGTYRGYIRTKKEEHLNTVVKLAYMLGKSVGKEEMRNE